MPTSHAKIFLRLAVPGDAASLADILLASFVEYQPLYSVAGFRATTISADAIIARMNEGPVWIAELRERIIATVSIVADGRSLYIRGMAVHPAARGHRIGELLLTRVQEFAINEGFERLFLSTTPFLDRAIRLYEGFGFARIDDGPHDLLGTPLFTMEKRLLRHSEAR